MVVRRDGEGEEFERLLWRWNEVIEEMEERNEKWALRDQERLSEENEERNNSDQGSEESPIAWLEKLPEKREVKLKQYLIPR